MILFDYFTRTILLLLVIRRKLSLFLILSVLPFTVVSLGSFNAVQGSEDNDTEHRTSYGCTLEDSGNTHCDIMPNDFTSSLAIGKAQKIYEIDSSLQPVKGKIGNALALKGYIGQYLTIPNNKSLNPQTFSLSFWMKQDPAFGLDGAVLSHVNKEKTAGWFFEVHVQPSPKILFSVVNSLGKVFTTEANITNGEFKNVVGTFDGKFLRLYSNGIIKDSVQYSGVYQADPNVPLNVGLDSFDLDKAWEGLIDDIHFFNEPLFPAEIKSIYEGTDKIIGTEIGHWPFDNSTIDLSPNRNDARIISQVVSMTFVPDGRMFFTEKNTGRIRVMSNDRIIPEPFVTVKNIFVAQHQGLLGITADPKFSLNHYIYAYYTWKDNKTDETFNRVSRFTESNNKAIEEKVLLDKIPASSEGEFAGGALAFGTDDKLYITSGHANSLELPQNRSSLIGKVLRINRDGSIPSDNPFKNSPIYTLGHRNDYGIAFDNNGHGLVTENGETHYDEVNLLRKGGNYGFPTTQPPGKSPQLDNSSSIKPIRSYWTDIAPTQAIFYHGNKFQDLKDRFIFGSFNEGSMYALRLNESYAVKDEMIIYFPGLVENIISIAQSPTGRIYFGGYNIYELLSTEPVENEKSIYFVDITSHNTKINNIVVSPNRSNLMLSVTTGTDNQHNPPNIDVIIPKALMAGIYQVSSSEVSHNKTGILINHSDIKEQFRAANVGNTIVHINLSPGTRQNIIIKGTSQNSN